MGHIPVASPSPIPHFRFPKRGAAFFVLGAGFAAAIILAAAFTWPTGSKVDQGPVNWVTVARADQLQLYQPIVVREYRIVLVKLPDQVLALSRRDPHLGCTVPWRPDFDFLGQKGWFRNPCHAETYDLTGRCFAGPCARGLDRCPVAIEGDNVRVNVTQPILGPPFLQDEKPLNPPR